MASDPELPPTVDKLIDLLDRTFPLQHFPVTADLPSIQRELGKRDVVVFLRSLQRARFERDE